MAKLYFRYSAMNAGKSTALLQVAHNYEVDLGQGVLIFTAAVDDRFGVGKVSSRLGISHEAETFDRNTHFVNAILRHVDEDADPKFGKTLAESGRSLGCVLIDEAQFLTLPQVSAIHQFAHLVDVPVICYGLRTDFAGRAFEGSGALLALADAIEELKTVCSVCKHRKATMNPRVDANERRILEGPQIGIEGTAFAYAPMCPGCFYEAGTTS
jgi:thymidine kinase